MVFSKTNIENKLEKAKSKSSILEDCRLKDVYALLSNLDDELDRIEDNLATKRNITQNKFNVEFLEHSRIYHIDDIKNICIDYRLRFLDSKFFKGKLPIEAISKIKDLEKIHNIELKGFKIIAPSKLFKLEDKDDPLLFAPIGNGYHYLIHKWGNDLLPMRKLLVWPFKNIANLTVLVFFISYMVTMLIPEGLFSKSNSTTDFLIINFFMFKCIAAVVIFYGFALGKNFSPAIWNSKYFNS